MMDTAAGRGRREAIGPLSLIASSARGSDGRRVSGVHSRAVGLAVGMVATGAGSGAVDACDGTSGGAASVHVCDSASGIAAGTPRSISGRGDG